MFARFDENPAMTLRVIKETKRYGRTHGQRENSIPPTNKVCGGYKDYDRRLTSLRLTAGRVAVSSPCARTFIHCLVLVQPRKTCPDILKNC